MWEKISDLVNKHFPTPSKMDDIYFRNSIKFTYRCFDNVRRIIQKHDYKLKKNVVGNRKSPCSSRQWHYSHYMKSA